MKNMVDADHVLRIEQSLHGYHRGHGLVASSFFFDKNTAAMLSSISDASSLGYCEPEPSYLSGYPIPQLSRYAVARTWPAGEMSRPGCVWTHTIYIDYSDLARCSSLHFIKDIFIRPIAIEDFSRYQKALEVRRDTRFVGEIDEEEFYLIRKGLYGTTSQLVLPWKNSSESTMLCVWSQQWPKLRRSIRFRTYGSPSSGNDKFDVLFVRPKSGLLIDRADRESNINEIYVDASLSNDLLDLNPDFKEFSWRYGADFDATRTAYIPISKLWKCWKKENNLEKTLDYMTSEMNEVPRSLGADVIHSYLCQNEDSDSLIHKVYSLLDKIRLSDLTDQDVEELTKRMAKLSAVELIDIFYKHLSHSNLITGLIAEISTAKKVEMMVTDPALIQKIVIASPAVINEADFWRSVNIQLIPWENIKGSSEINLKTILVSAIDCQQMHAVEKIIDVFNDCGMLALLEVSDEIKGSRNIAPILGVISAHRELALVALNQSEKLSLRILETLSYWFRPQDEHTGYDAQCWYNAISRSKESIGVLYSDLACFALIKGLLGNTIESLNLISITFESVHGLLSRTGTGYKYWDTLDYCLPRVSNFFDWDRCQRLRKGVIVKFCGRNDAILIFLKMARSRWSFEELIETALSFDDGRAFIRAIIESNLATNDQLECIRMKI